MAATQKSITRKPATLAKLSAPSLVDVLPRERLFALLDSIKTPIVWLSAPPGSGKTTLAASYFASRKLQVLWLQLDADDADPATFFHYLSMAACQLSSRCKKLPVPDRTQRSDWLPFTRRYVRELCSLLDQPVVLALDNVQEISGGVQDEVLACLAAEISEPISLFMFSHGAPTAGFSPLLAQRKMTVVDWTAISFTANETQQLMTTLHPLEQDRSQHIHDLTRGWAAGVVLLGYARDFRLDAPAFDDTRTGVDLFAYFATTILKQMPAEMVHTLQCVAMLPEFTADMARQLSAVDNAAKWILLALQRHLFITRFVSPAGLTTFQFHPLFQKFLRERCRQSLDPTSWFALLKQAASLCGDTGPGRHPIQPARPEWQVRLYAEAGAFDEAVTTVIASAPAWVRASRLDLLRELVALVEPHAQERAGWIAFWKGMALTHYDETGTRIALEAAYQAHLLCGDTIGQLLAASAIADAMTAGWRSFKDMEQWSAVLSALYRPDLEFPDAGLELIAVTGILAAAIIYAGPSPHVAHAALRGLALLDADTDINQRLAMVTLLIYYFDNFGPGERQVEAINVGKLLLKTPGITDYRRALWYYWLACYHLQTVDVQGNGATALKQAGDCIDSASEIATGHQFAGVLFGRDSLHADILMRNGDFAGAEKKLVQAEQWLSPIRPTDTMQCHFKKTQLALRRHDLPAALASIKRVIESAEQSHMPERPISSYRWTEAIVHVKMQNFSLAYAPARRAIESASPAHVHLCHLALAGYEAMEALHHHLPTRIEKLTQFFQRLREQQTVQVFTMLPRELAQLAAAALSEKIETDFVKTLIRQRQLTPPLSISSLASLSSNWPYPLRIHALGAFYVERHGERFTITGKVQKKPMELLKLMAAEGAAAFSGVPADKIIDELWPDAAIENPKANFDITVHRLRKLLDIDNAVLFNDGSLSFNREIVWCDTAAFEALTGVDNTSSAAEPLSMPDREMVALYRGPLLAGETDFSWLISPRERYAAKFIGAIGRTASQLRQMGDEQSSRAALALYEHGLLQDGLVESFYSGAIEICLELRQTSEALRIYRRCEQLFSLVLGIKPSNKMQALREQITHQSA